MPDVLDKLTPEDSGKFRAVDGWRVTAMVSRTTMSLHCQRLASGLSLTGTMRARAGKYWAMIVLLLLYYPVTLMAEQDFKMIDVRDTGDLRASAGNQWRLVTDGVMGGVSQGKLTAEVVEGRPCLRLRGDVKLENNGGFIQGGLSLPDEVLRDVTAYTGLVLEVYGNGEQYNVHLRTADIWLPWQSYRATFTATPQWQQIFLPFNDFKPHRISSELDVTRLERIGLVAIGRQFTADLCIGKVGFYK